MVNKNIEQENYISLYDYLGKAAGASLGKQVNEYAQIRKQLHKTRYVDNPTYKGYVNLYTREFLQEFFQTKYALTNEK